MDKEMQMAFVGGGVMAEAMIRGILNKDLTSPQSIIASDINVQRLETLNQRHGVIGVSDNRSAVERAEVVILAIKPQVLDGVMKELKGVFQPRQLVLSIVAGATLTTLHEGLNHRALVRVMPNMPAQIGQGISMWTATTEVIQEQKEIAQSILSALGREIFVPDERLIDMATAVSGSGPAYVFLVIESLVDAAVHIGLPRELAEELVVQTVLGATHLVQATGKHPAELKGQVVSPGGTTAEGLLRLEEGGVRALFTQAVIAAYQKAKSLSSQEK